MEAQLPVALSMAAKELAERQQYGSMNDFLTALVANAVGEPQYAPSPRTQQEELPLKSA